MTKTTYICDRCATEFDDRTQLRCLSAGIGTYYGSNSWEKKWTADWCLKCLDAFGIIPENPDVAAVVHPEITLEDMIRGIVRLEVGQ
jgi:hypothetical protein